MSSNQEMKRTFAGITRRGFLAEAACVGSVVALGAFAGFSSGSSAAALVRPPGAQDDSYVISRCIRCNKCMGACPRNVITIGLLEDGIVNVRTPKMDFRLGYCDMCDGEYKCAAACPVDAFASFDPLREKLGIAVIDESACALFGISAHCSAPCIDACKWNALVIDGEGRLKVIDEKCNGCGACEFVCPADSYGNYRNNGNRGINVLAFGQAGGSNVA